MIKMKKIYIYICILVIITSFLFCINIFLEKHNQKHIDIVQEEEKKEEEEAKYEIDYKANQTITVKLCKSNEVVAMDVNDYLRGVLPSEMPPYYDIEALKAQAIVARTYLYRKIKYGNADDNADICDSSAHCQAFYNKEKIIEIWKSRGFDEQTINQYWKNVNEAVVSTYNQVITYNGDIIRAYFHASSPSRTEDISQIWGGESIPYLISVENNEAEDYPNRTSTVTLSFNEIASILNNAKILRGLVNANDISSISICENTTSGRVKNVLINNQKLSAEKMRTLFGLKSTNFTIQVCDNNVIFNVVGYGHGVGMSQVGADYYAKLGMNYIDIIKHYYTGVEVYTLETKEE